MYRHRYDARPIKPVVLAALSIGLAVGLAVVWIYFFGNGNRAGAPSDTGIRAVVSGAPHRTLTPPERTPGLPGLERESQGSAFDADGTVESPIAIVARSATSNAGIEDDGRPAYVEERNQAESETASPSSRRASPIKSPAPSGDLAISGRVLTRAGTPVAGIELTATAAYILDPDEGRLVHTHGYRRKTTSAYDGSYEFRRLADGEYHIHTTANEHFAQARISVRAGADFADLVLLGQQDLRVRGVVSTPLGEPLQGVTVQPVTRAGQAATTDRYGQYAFEMKALETARSLFVRAWKDGFKETKIPLEIAELEANEDTVLNIVLEPDTSAELAVVSGTVRSSTGVPIVGQRIQMSSGTVRQSYRATTDEDGEFLIQRVEPSDDYLLSINAPDAYQDYFQRNLRVTEDGVALNIELQTKEVGTLSGQMVDVYGNPISHFSLVLQTKKTSYYNARVVGDAVGAFVVENAPAGELRFKTKSNPYHRVEGVRLAPGSERHVVLVLDSGYTEIRGRVLDNRGLPLAVPSIHLTWAHAQPGVLSSSRRTTAADEQGYFHFTQLGPGPHTVSINLPDFKPVRFRHDSETQGPDVVVRLEKQKK